VVIYATAASTSSIVKASSQRGQPVVATWTRKGAQLTETHGLSVAAR